MFDQLYKSRGVIARHHSGPLLKERLAFLTHLANQGFSPFRLQSKARDLMATARMLRLAGEPRKALTVAEVERGMTKRRRLCRFAVQWLQFMGRLRQRTTPLTPEAEKIKAFADYMEHEVDLSPVTIFHRCWWIRRFFGRLRVRGGSLDKLTPHRIDVASQKMLESDGYSRVTVQCCAGALRAFFRFAEARDGAVKDWLRPYGIHGCFLRHPCHRGRHGTM